MSPIKKPTLPLDSGTVLQLKVTLADIAPPIWRRLLVPASMSLAQLHLALQISMGWTDSHLHNFEIGGEEYGRPDQMDGASIRDERKVVLSSVLGPKGKATYDYDFGDGWSHAVRVEKVLPADEAGLVPRCLGGERACPPEDCGGPPGYFNLIDALADPKHPSHVEMVEWIGEFDAEAFDLADIDEGLATLRAKRRKKSALRRVK